MAAMHENDLLIITADHGCDPSTPSTDHSREYVPVLIYRMGMNGTNLHIGHFSDVAATTLDFLGVEKHGLSGKTLIRGGE